MTNQEQLARMGILGILLTISYLIILGKVLWIQTRQSSLLCERAERQYDTKLIILPQRGTIFDRHGSPLTHTIEQMSAFVIPRIAKDRDGLCRWLIAQGYPTIAQRIMTQPDGPFCFVQRHLSDEQYAEWRTNGHPDLQFVLEAGRSYPLSCAGCFVGVTTVDNEGAFGIERICNATLQGIPRHYTLKRDARVQNTFYFERTITQEGNEGSPVTLTIDSTLQFMAHQEVATMVEQLEAHAGAALIIDPQTGEIIACVQHPSLDPNDTHNRIPTETTVWPFIHTFEFGSVIKIFLALAALAEGIVTLDTPIDCHNTKSITISGMKLTTWAPHGVLSFRDVIAQSNNIGTAQVALMLGEKLYEHYRRCGFGSPTGLQWPGEAVGHVTHPSTWCVQSLASLSYGYEIRATLLQLACAYALIIRNGTPVHPSLIKDPSPKHQTQQPIEQLYEPHITAQLHTMLEHTVQSGTAKRAALTGYHVCGKTGSAYVLKDGAYQKEKNIFTFVGHVQHNDYERIIVTCIVEPRSSKLFASQTTAPLFERIAERMVIHERVSQRSPTCPSNLTCP